jgi:hypothetical protein
VRRAAPWLTAAAGAALAAAGVAVFARANRPSGGDVGWSAYAPLQPAGAYDSRLELSFDGGWAVLWTTGHLGGAGLVVLGLLLLSGLGGWLLGRRARPAVRRPPRGVLLLGGTGCLLVVAGIVVVLTTGAEPVVTYSGSDPSPSCPGISGCGSWSAVFTAGPLAGLGAAVGGALLLAGVSGRLLGGDRRSDAAADQQ